MSNTTRTPTPHIYAITVYEINGYHHDTIRNLNDYQALETFEQIYRDFNQNDIDYIHVDITKTNGDSVIDWQIYDIDYIREFINLWMNA